MTREAGAFAHLCTRCGSIVFEREGLLHRFQPAELWRRRKWVIHTDRRCELARVDLEMQARGYIRRTDTWASDDLQASAIALLRQLDPVEVELPKWFRSRPLRGPLVEMPAVDGAPVSLAVDLPDGSLLRYTAGAGPRS